MCVCYAWETSTGETDVRKEFLGFSSIPTLGAKDITSATATLSSKCLWVEYAWLGWLGRGLTELQI